VKVTKFEHPATGTFTPGQSIYFKVQSSCTLIERPSCPGGVSVNLCVVYACACVCALYLMQVLEHSLPGVTLLSACRSSPVNTLVLCTRMMR